MVIVLYLFTAFNNLLTSPKLTTPVFNMGSIFSEKYGKSMGAKMVAKSKVSVAGQCHQLQYTLVG